VATVLYAVELIDFAQTALTLGFLAVLCLDSIAGSLDRMSTPPRWNLPRRALTPEEVDELRQPASLFEASDALKRRQH
jgi:hypothetical protein